MSIGVVGNPRKVSSAARRQAWSAWRVSDGHVRVQINEPALANAFAKVPGAEKVGYNVLGPYTRIFSVGQSVGWVDGWMKKQLSNNHE